MRLSVREEGAGTDLRPRESDPIAAWLGLFGALAGLPKRERAEVREELSDHLRERVRELMVRGLGEHEAVRAAIEELGGAAEMAVRFRLVRSNSRRRLAMNLSMFGLAGAAAVLSVVAVLQPGAGGSGSVYTPPARAEPQESMGKVIDLEFREQPVAEALGFLGAAAGMPVHTHWSGLGFGPDDTITLEAKRVTLDGALQMVGEWSDQNGWAPIDFRVAEGTLEIASREYFDHQESSLVSYDLSPAAERGVESGDVVKVIMSLVEPDGWRDNGGKLATAYVLGDRLFVEAPPRYQAKVKWILGELASGSPAVGKGEGADAKVGAAGESSFRRYIFSNVAATDVCDRLRKMVGSAERLKILSDSQSNSVLVGGSPEAVEAAVVSGMDIAKGAANSAGGSVLVIFEKDGRQETVFADSARVVPMAELLEARPKDDAQRMLLDFASRRTLKLEEGQTIPWLPDLPLIRESVQVQPAEGGGG